MNKQDFITKYPATLLELLTSPCVFRENFPFMANLPYPGISHIRFICEYGNYTYGAIRTALSRTIKAKKLEVFIDENKVKRYKLTKSQQNISQVLLADKGESNDFSLVVFTFTADQEEERREARFLLKSYGFRLFAQNTYIRRNINRHLFENSVKEYGLEKNVFLFDCPDPGTEEFKKKLFTQFEIDKSVEITNTFLDDLKSFLGNSCDEEEFAIRLLYAGPVYYTICFTNEIPIPERYFPKNYRIKELKTFFAAIPDYKWQEFINFYMNIENSGGNR